MENTPKVGDRVTIPFGLEDAAGTVVRVHEQGSNTEVVVKLDADQELNFPLDAVQPQSEA